LRAAKAYSKHQHALSNNDALYRRFQEFKLNAMRLPSKWMQAIQEGCLAPQGRAEDLADIIASELEIHQ